MNLITIFVVALVAVIIIIPGPSAVSEELKYYSLSS